MSDLIQVQLPRDVVEQLRRSSLNAARASRNSATATEKHAPNTSRNRLYVERMKKEAEQHEDIAAECHEALKAQPEVTDHAAD